MARRRRIGTPGGSDERPATFFADAAEFRAWLEAHHETATELWMGLRKKHVADRGLTWDDAVPEALCFGWIDSVAQRIVHWLTAALILFNLLLPGQIERVVDLLGGGKTPTPEEWNSATLHIYSGFAILASAMIRLGLRFVQGNGRIRSRASGILPALETGKRRILRPADRHASDEGRQIRGIKGSGSPCSPSCGGVRRHLRRRSDARRRRP